MTDKIDSVAEEFQSIQLLELLFDSVRDGIAIFDAEGRVRSCNAAMAMITGQPCEYLVGKRPTEGWGGRDPEPQPTGTLTSAEQTMVRADGRRRSVSVRTVFLQGNPPVHAAIYRDITHYKNLERRERESEDQYRFLVEHINDGILITRAGRVLYVNDALVQMLGCDRAEVLQQDRAMLGKRLPQHGLPDNIGSETLERYEATCWRADGTDLHVEVSLSQGPYAGETATFEVVRDVSERHRADIRSQTMLKLGQRLNLATSPAAVARITMDVAQELFGWDACTVELSNPYEDGPLEPILYVDTINGNRVEVTAAPVPSGPAVLSGKALTDGSFLLLRKPDDTVQRLYAFGDMERLSLSLMFVPIQGSPNVVGVMSVQSYTQNAYSQADLLGFQALADHCTGALQRTRAIEALQESEQRYRQMFQNNRAMKLLVDPVSGEILDANSSACEFYGIEKQKLCGMSLMDFSTEPVEQIRDELQRSLTGASGPIHFIHKLASGEERQVEVFASPIASMGKTLLHSIIYDVTERELAFAQIAGLADLGKRLGSATNSTDVGRILVDVADKLIGWDACSVDLFASEVEQQVMTPGHLLLPVLHMDLIKGVRREVQPRYPVLPASTISYSVLQEGPQLILRQEGEDLPVEGRMFGDSNRRSASLMFVPITGSSGILGVVSIQSYTYHAFTQQDVQLLGNIASHCAGAMERTRAEEQVRLLESAVRLASDMIIITSADPSSVSGTRIVFVNDAVLQMTGYTHDDLIGQSISILQGPDTNQETLAAMHMSLIEGKPVKVELANYRKDRSAYITEFSAYSICDMFGRPRYFVSVQRDITERKRTEAELTYRAFHDPLTDLPNRSLLLERLQHAIARSSRSAETFAVLFLDLDGFKEVNDRLGHDAGDLLLMLAARRLETCVRPGDTVARLGGDEFVVLLEAIESIDIATRISDRILESFQEPFVLNGQQAVCTASVGIAQQPTNGTSDATDVLKLADMALYQAKMKGKGRYEIFIPPPLV